MKKQQTSRARRLRVVFVVFTFPFDEDNCTYDERTSHVLRMVDYLGDSNIDENDLRFLVSVGNEMKSEASSLTLSVLFLRF